MTSLTNILQQTGVSLARLKGFVIRLLSATDDAINGTTCSSITLQPGFSVGNPLDFNNGGSGLTITVTVSGGAIATVAIGAAGTGYPPSTTFMVNIIQAGSTGGTAMVTTNSSGVPTAVALGTAGASYTAATLPTIVLGTSLINNSGCRLYFDPSAAGFSLVSATAKNIRFTNNDQGGAATNAAAVQISLVGGTT
jgi:hypothetical protein